EEAGDQRRRAAERQGADVAQHAHLRPARQELPAQHGAAPLGDEEARQATEQRQDPALREQLRQQARPTHTQRQPNGDLTAAAELRRKALVRSALAAATLTPAFRCTSMDAHIQWYVVHHLSRGGRWALAWLVMGMNATGRCTGHSPANPSGATPMIV